MAWPVTAAELEREQEWLAMQHPPGWDPPGRRLSVAAAFVAFVRGEQGPGHPGDRAWVGAVLLDGRRVARSRVIAGVAGASYRPGLLALREGPMLESALKPLAGEADVVLVDATGRDHPRGAGLALHLGAVLGVPSVGVTHRALAARGGEPDDEAGVSVPLRLGGVEVARAVRTVRGVRPVVAHAAWRTDPETAAAVVVACSAGARTPEPLRQARRVARTAREERAGLVGTDGPADEGDRLATFQNGAVEG